MLPPVTPDAVEPPVVLPLSPLELPLSLLLPLLDDDDDELDTYAVSDTWRVKLHDTRLSETV